MEELPPLNDLNHKTLKTSKKPTGSSLESYLNNLWMRRSKTEISQKMLHNQPQRGIPVLGLEEEDQEQT